MNAIPRLLFLCLSVFYAAAASGQTTITNGDGTPLTTVWCWEDTLHPIAGQPVGGIFTGCGVISDNGSWYFNPSIAGGAAGGSNCVLTYTPPGGGSEAQATMSIKQKITVTVFNDSIITCDGFFYLTGDELPVGDYKRYWSPGANLDDSTKKNTGGTTNVTQSYVYTCYNTSNQCTGKDTVTVLYEAVEAVATQSKDTVCVMEPVYFTAGYDSTYHYAWLSGDGQTGGDTIAWQFAYGQAGNYEAMLIVNNEFCADTAIRPVSVRGFELSLSASTALTDRGNPLSLQTSSDESYTVTAWRPSELFADQSALSQNIEADTTRTYTVYGMSAYGCADSAEVLVSVNPILYLPSSFTPNGDGRNDYFRIRSWGDAVNVKEFRVFDRWGKEVWSGSGAEALTGWDGTYNGTPAVMGVYYYTMEIQPPQSAGIVKQGDVTLIR